VLRQNYNMTNRYERGRNHTSLMLLHSRRTIEAPISSVLKILDVQEIIRVPLSDYPPQTKPGSIFTHFGLPVFDTQVGSLAALSKIVAGGYFDPKGEEQLPLLLKIFGLQKLLDSLSLFLTKKYLKTVSRIRLAKHTVQKNYKSLCSPATKKHSQPLLIIKSLHKEFQFEIYSSPM